MNALPTLVVLTEDTAIQQILVENNLPMDRPTPPFDMCIGCVRDPRRRSVWLVLRFFQTGDEGYMAFGLPDSTNPRDIREMFAFLLEPYAEKPAQYIVLPELAVN